MTTAALANLVLDPIDWPWGSARAHAGLERPAIPLDETPLRAAFDGDPNWRDRYRRMIQRQDDAAPPGLGLSVAATRP